MLMRLLQFLGVKKSTPALPFHSGNARVVAVQVAPDRANLADAALPIYPPLDAGIPVAAATKVVATQHEIIQRLRQHVALPTEQFTEEYLAPIERVAALAGLLPATRSSYHTGQGGLFRLAVEVAFACARSSDGVVFSARSSIDRRRGVDSAWRHAAFLAGLTCELHRPLTDMVVVGDTGATWSPYLGPLDQWANQTGQRRLFVRWSERAVRDPGNQASALWVLSHVAGPRAMAALHEADPSISPTLAAVVAGVVDRVNEPQLSRIVRQSLEGVRARDQAQQASMYGHLTQGAHLEPWLLDSMRELVRSAVWRINEPQAHLLWASDGLFLRWPAAAEDIVRELGRRGQSGVPTHASTLAELLLNAAVVARAATGGPIWTVTPASGADPTTALKFVRPESILGDIDPQRAPPAPWGHAVAVAPGARAAPAASAPAEGTPTTPGATQAATAAAEPGAAASTTTPPATPRVAVALMGEATASAPTRVAQHKHPAVAGQPRDATAARHGAGQAGAPPEAGDERPRKARKPGAPIAYEESPEAAPGIVLDEQLARALGSAAVAGLVGEWVSAWNTAAKPHCFKAVPGGLAVRLELLGGSGVGPQQLFTPLKENGWLVLHESRGGRKSPSIEMEFDTPQGPDKALAIVLTEAFARRAGCVL
jgi:conjugal transfer pilus assembly protein TraI